MSFDQNKTVVASSMVTTYPNNCPICNTSENVSQFLHQDQTYNYCSNCKKYFGYYLLIWDAQQTDPTGPASGTVSAG